MRKFELLSAIDQLEEISSNNKKHARSVGEGMPEITFGYLLIRRGSANSISTQSERKSYSGYASRNYTYDNAGSDTATCRGSCAGTNSGGESSTLIDDRYTALDTNVKTGCLLLFVILLDHAFVVIDLGFLILLR
jgi:hypothetical protein